MYEFLQMGGYADYVWSAYGLGLIVLVLNVVIPVYREKQLRQTLAEKNNTDKPE